MPRGGKRPGAGRPGGWKTGPAKVSVSLPADLAEAVMSFARALDSGEAIAPAPSNESSSESIALKAALLDARQAEDRILKRLELARRLLAAERERPRIRREALDGIMERLMDTRGTAVRTMDDAELRDFAKPIPRGEGRVAGGLGGDDHG